VNAERYARIREVFLAARHLTGDARSAVLERVGADDATLRREVELLLADAEQADTFLQTPIVGEGAVAKIESSIGPTGEDGKDSGVPDAHPERIGRFRILGVLGIGGMGIVYRAEQDNPRRTVALKVIRSGVRSKELLRRFEHESQVLGWLQHPGIAQIYDAGTAGDRAAPQPYFAMELVSGKRITEYADRKELDRSARLALLAKVADAVHHAHQKGVIHRDLKPSNILVDESGQPKVLDFGVSRVVDDERRGATLTTSTGQLIGTLDYMSPEQVLGGTTSVDIRSDVYALGVVGYELITGRLPHDLAGKPIPHAARLIGETEPARPSSIDRTLRGDTETIILTALSKDPQHRYQSANELAMDIRRHLNNEPILARPASALYHLGKFTRRNKTLVATISVALVALAATLVSLANQRDRAVAAERLAGQRLQLAEEEAAKASAVNDFLDHMLASVDPRNRGRDVRMADVLDRAGATIEQNFAERPEVEYALRATIGSTYFGLGLYDEAAHHLRRAHELALRVAGTEADDTLDIGERLADVLSERDEVDEAETLIRGVLDARLRKDGEAGRKTLAAMNGLAEVLKKKGAVQEARSLWQRVLELQRDTLSPDDPQRLIAMNNMASLLDDLGDPRAAESLLRETLALQREVEGEEHPHTLATMSNLAWTLKRLGQVTEAEQLYLDVIAIRKRTIGSHPSTFVAINNLARLLHDEKRYSKALPLYGEVLEGFREKFGVRSPKVMIVMNNTAKCLVDAGRAEEAEPVYEELMQMTHDVLPPDHWMALVFQGNYGNCLALLGRFEEAERLVTESYEKLAAALGPRHDHTVLAIRRCILLYETWHKPGLVDEWNRRLAEATASTGSVLTGVTE